ncbi:MAG: hypothetical protein LBV12_06120, partial [Puniceicoccales bacterium]|nr:hypothetical protein [Puniceicoccales bacterium]
MQVFRQGWWLFGLGVCSLPLAFLLCGCPDTASSGLPAAVPVETIHIPSLDVVLPARTASLDRKLVPECSGFAASRRYPGVIWTLSDSGNPNVIVAIQADGSVVKPASSGAGYKGITVSGVRNVDWEALALDANGELIIGNIGNNLSNRKDLSFLAFPEPDPRVATQVKPREIKVRYADQTDFPDRKKRYDCEAMFIWNGKVYVLTKRWSDTWTVLYRLDIQADGTGLFMPVTSFNSHGLVTDAAISPDGRLLAILTYHGIWAFVLPTAGSNPLNGEALYRPLQFPLKSWQVEALAFSDNDHLLIGSEEGDLYTLEVSRLAKV